LRSLHNNPPRFQRPGVGTDSLVNLALPELPSAEFRLLLAVGKVSPTRSGPSITVTLPALVLNDVIECLAALGLKAE